MNAAEVSGHLAERVDALIAELLPAARREGAEWRVGSLAGEPGHSMAIRRSGPKAGVWKDFASGEAGDAIGLVKAVLRLPTAEAIGWSLRWLGLDDHSGVARRRPTKRFDVGDVRRHGANRFTPGWRGRGWP